MMEKKIVFGRWEVVTILINMICTKIFLNFPRKMEEEAGNAAWMLAIYISLLTFLLFFIITKLYKRFEGKDLLDVGEYLGGGIGRILVGTVVVVFLIYTTSVYFRTFTENMKIVALTVSPISFVSLFFLVGMIVAAYFGLEAIARFHAFVIPIVATGFMIIMIAVMPFMDLSLLLPIMGKGSYSIFVNGIPKVSIFSEFILVFLLIPFIKTHKNFKTSGFAALGFSSFFLILAAFIYAATIPFPNGVERALPIYHLARLINYGRFFQRIESIFVLIWAAAALLYIAVGFYFIIYVFKKAFKLEYDKPLILPFAILIFNISLLPPNLMSAVVLETEYFREYSWLVTFGLTILILAAARFRKKDTKERKSAS
ncbi:MAG: spore germination protein [Clostridia bacterium]|nr:spore germination protein [Clostridia bacterium]